MRFIIFSLVRFLFVTITIFIASDFRNGTMAIAEEMKPLKCDGFTAFSQRLFNILYSTKPLESREIIWETTDNTRGLYEKVKSSGDILTVIANGNTKASIKAYFVPLSQIKKIEKVTSSRPNFNYDDLWKHTYLYNLIPDSLPPHEYLHDIKELSNDSYNAAMIRSYDYSMYCGIIPDLDNGEYYVLFLLTSSNNKTNITNYPCKNRCLTPFISKITPQYYAYDKSMYILSVFNLIDYSDEYSGHVSNDARDSTYASHNDFYVYILYVIFAFGIGYNFSKYVRYRRDHTNKHL